MTIRKLKLAMPFSLAVFTICVFFAACDFWAAPQNKMGELPQSHTRSALNRKDVLALWHLAESHETPEEELRNQVQAMLQHGAEAEAQRGNPVTASVITGVQRLSNTVEEGFSSVTANRRSKTTVSEKTEIPFYVFYLENQTKQTRGFALTCGDARIGNLLALVEKGDYEDTDNPFWSFFNACLDNYILRTIEQYNSVKDEDIAVAIAISKTEESRTRISTDSFNDWYVKDYVAPMTTTQWDQDTPYYDVINSVAGRSSNQWLTGCAATAMAQIMAYHEWPRTPHFPIRKPSTTGNSTQEIFNFNDPNTGVNTAFSSIEYDWANMKLYPDATHHDSDIEKKIQTHIGVLMLAIGDKSKMEYGIKESGASTSDMSKGIKNMTYFSSTVKSYNFDAIKTSLDEGKPVYVSGYDTSKPVIPILGIYKYSGGHAWVIDGYKTTYSNTVLANGFPPIVYYVGLVKFVRCNVGWGGTDNGWYFNEVFDMDAGPVVPYRSMTENYFQFNLEIIQFIKPDKRFGGGTGTANDPYIITKAEHLDNVHVFSDSNNYFKLESNINLQNYPQNDPWIPFYSFNGHFDGNGKTISNLKISYVNYQDDYGLFESNYGTIKNLNVSANIDLTNIPAGYQNAERYVGVIAGYNYGTIENCLVYSCNSSPMINCKPFENITIGGIVGINQGQIISCTGNGIIYCSGNTGGIAGINRSIITDSINCGMICYLFVSANRGIGGIAGVQEVSGSSVTGSKNIDMVVCVNDVTDSNVLQPRMANIIGHRKAGTTSENINVMYNYVKADNLRTVYHNGVAHDQARYVGSREVGQ